MNVHTAARDELVTYLSGTGYGLLGIYSKSTDELREVALQDMETRDTGPFVPVRPKEQP